jgi:hypothetical protein
VAGAGLLDVVGDLDGDGDEEVEVPDRPPGSGGTGAQGSRKTAACSGMKALPIQPSASSPVSSRLRGPSDATWIGTSTGATGERMARPGPSGRGSRYVGPSCASRSPRATIRTISIVSLVRPIGDGNRTPCHPSITCGPLVPIPSRKRPSDSSCIDIADMASIAGVRAPSCAMPVASSMVEVRAAR